jgi:hypothetical protein
MLIQILFAFFMLCGVAALYVDLGIARLTQVQMQNAADPAALEGLRWRDSPPDPADCPTLDIPCLENARRSTAALLASELDAGPNVAFQDDPNVATLNGAEVHASQTLDFRATVQQPALRPALEKNFPDNAQEGDMVSGAYAPNGCPAVLSRPHAESADYCREDFIVSDPSRRSFLVRLRRTNGFRGLDNAPGNAAGNSPDIPLDNQLGISSSGPRIPLLFGRAGTLQQIGDSMPRVDGIPVRAAAIADARPALRVGPAAAGLRGITPFAITHAFWSLLRSAGGQAVFADPSGLLCQGITPTCSTTVGKFWQPNIPATPVIPATTVGAEILLAAPRPADVSAVYVPIYDLPPADGTCTMLGATERVIGFGYIQITGAVSDPSFVVDLNGSQLAPANASAVVAGGFPAPPDQLAGILRAKTCLANEGPLLLVPALVR